MSIMSFYLWTTKGDVRLDFHTALYRIMKLNAEFALCLNISKCAQDFRDAPMHFFFLFQIFRRLAIVHEFMEELDEHSAKCFILCFVEERKS